MSGIVSRLNEDLWSRIEASLVSKKSQEVHGKNGEQEEVRNGGEDVKNGEQEEGKDGGEGSTRFMITV